MKERNEMAGIKNKGKVFSLIYSKIKGIPKAPILKGLLIEGTGLEKDAHAEGGLKQVSLLSMEAVMKQIEFV